MQSGQDLPKLFPLFFEENFNGQMDNMGIFLKYFQPQNLPFPRINYYSVASSTFCDGLKLYLFLDECFGGCYILKHKMY